MPLKISVSENIPVYEQHLCEMARVGFADDLIVWVWTDDPGYVPHVHVVDRATKGRNLDVCVRLDRVAYFSHGNHDDKFSAAQRKAFNEFMHLTPRNGLTGTNYEYAVALWNDNNSSVTVSLSRDDEGNVFIPDYSTL